MSQKKIGPTFSAELAAHGGLIGQHFAWFPDGTLEFFDDTPDSVKEGIEAVYAAHNPDAVPLDSIVLAAFAAGLQITSVATPGINGTYAVDAQSQADIVAIETSINAGKGFPGGGSMLNYPDMLGAGHPFNESNFSDFAAAVRDYVYALKSVIAGGSTTLPGSTAAIT